MAWFRNLVESMARRWSMPAVLILLGVSAFVAGIGLFLSLYYWKVHDEVGTALGLCQFALGVFMSTLANRVARKIAARPRSRVR
jgi:hypothetical protein